MHSAIHWLKACGIIDKFVDDLMNADPLIPLPIENDNKPLVFTQLSMLWLIWVSGLIAGVLAFLGELVARIIAKKTDAKNRAKSETSPYHSANDRNRNNNDKY